MTKYTKKQWHLDQQTIPKTIHHLKNLYNLTTDDVLLLDKSTLNLHGMIEPQPEIHVGLRAGCIDRILERRKANPPETRIVKHGQTKYTYYNIFRNVWVRNVGANEFVQTKYFAGMHMYSLPDIRDRYERILANPRTTRKRQEEIQHILKEVGDKWISRNPAY